MICREIKIAQKILNRHNLKPPYDLHKLVANYANLFFEDLPFEADGVTIDVKSEKPDIYIDINLSSSRKNFTIAHELGHIIIPWHIGTIVSDINNYSLDDHISYRTLEAEANRFASELLMPSTWIIEILSQNITFKDKITRITIDSGCSLEAVLISVKNLCDEFRYILLVDENNFCLKAHSSNNQSHIEFQDKIFNKDDIPHLKDLEHFKIKNQDIITFTVGDYNYTPFLQDIPLTWQEIIDKILLELNIHEEINKTLQRINAILGSKIHDYHEMSIEETCKLIRLKYEGRDLDNIISHELFPVYIRKRVTELKQKKSSND